MTTEKNNDYACHANSPGLKILAAPLYYKTPGGDRYKSAVKMVWPDCCPLAHVLYLNLCNGLNRPLMADLNLDHTGDFKWQFGPAIAVLWAWTARFC